MGMTSATFRDNTYEDNTSIPENKHVRSQRFNDSASIMDTTNIITDTDNDKTMGGIPANLESGPLASFVDNGNRDTNNQFTKLSDKGSIITQYSIKDYCYSITMVVQSCHYEIIA